jgi:hypothetical protein
LQEIFTEILLIALFAVGVGTISSMVGIGGGIINTPLLIIIFFLDAQKAPATALVAALFVAIASSVAYYKQEPRPTIFKAGLFLAITTIPGSLVGVALRELITSDYVLRVIFGVSLFPVALKMLFARKKKGVKEELAMFDFSDVSRNRLALSLVGGFIGGIAAGMLGIGGGAVVVPVLTILMGLPIHAAVATSMFTMIFTASAGTARNYIGGHVDPFYGIALGIGMIVGAQIGPKIACRINAAQLKQAFGLVLVFPLIKMMKLGQMWLDPQNQSFTVATLGDIIIWLGIVIPIAAIRIWLARRDIAPLPETEEPCEIPSGP